LAKRNAWDALLLRGTKDAQKREFVFLDRINSCSLREQKPPKKHGSVFPDKTVRFWLNLERERASHSDQPAFKAKAVLECLPPGVALEHFPGI
jgi:hypothetical protein